MAKVLSCAVTGELVDRDIDASKNLRDWPDYASSALVEARAPVDTRATGIGVQTQARTTRSLVAGGATIRPAHKQRPVVVRLEPNPARQEEPRKGESHE